MPTPTRRSTARRPPSAWLIWAFGGLLVIACALVTVAQRPVVFVPPEVNISRQEDHSLGVPAMNPWDAWTGVGDPRTLRNWVAVVTVITFMAFVAVCVVWAVSRIRARALARRGGPQQTVPERTFERVAAARAVTDVVDESLSAMDVTRYVDDAIVACWQALERAADDNGLPRRPAETSTEYAVRLCDELGISSDGVRILAGLYREARFSGHDMPASAGDTASRMLTDLRAELAASPAGSTP